MVIYDIQNYFCGEAKERNYYANESNLMYRWSKINLYGVCTIAGNILSQFGLNSYYEYDVLKSIARCYDDGSLQTRQGVNYYTIYNVYDIKIECKGGIIHNLALYKNYAIRICVYYAEIDDFKYYVLEV